MAPQLYLITPADADPETFPATLMAVLNATEFSALLVRRGNLDADAYAKFAARLVNIGQGAGCAVLLEDDVALVKKIGADGVHISTGTEDLIDAIQALKPSMIVGAGNLQSRDDAMVAGEMDVDYVLFDDGELAQWWAETFEVPCVLSLPKAAPGASDPRGAEFLALSDSLWSAASPAEAMRAIAADLGADA